jgi:hypothetical protein
MASLLTSHSAIRSGGHKRQKPGRHFLSHGRKLPCGAAGGHAGERGSPTDTNVSKAPLCVVSPGCGRAGRRRTTEFAKFGKIDGLADRQTSEHLVNMTKDLWKVGRLKGLVLRAIPGIVEELREYFPKYVVVDGPEQAERPAAGEQVQECSGPGNVEFPRWKEQGSFAMLHLKGCFLSIACLVKGALRPFQLCLYHG